ncbi:MAG: hypothetical protein QOC89_4206 [Paraburkholderia sp.]|nr:hypothetical protein [Paraburkholderia sp.]
MLSANNRQKEILGQVVPSGMIFRKISMTATQATMATHADPASPSFVVSFNGAHQTGDSQLLQKL